MKSTGEVMGFDADFGTAFAKAQTAAFGSLPTSGRVFVSMANRDKRTMIFPIKVLADLGFEILATQGTAEVLRRNGVQATVVRKHFEGDGPDGEPTTVQLILDGEIDLVVNTPHGATSGGVGAARRLRDPHRGGPGQHPVHHDRAGARRRGAGHRGDARRRHRGALAAGLGRGDDGAVPLRCSTTWRPAPTPRRRTTPASGRSGPRGRSPGTRWAAWPGEPVERDGPELPRRARARGRLRQERASASTRWPRWASASSRSARSPASRSRATRGRGCSGCRPTGRSSTGWASTTTAPRWSPGGSRAPATARPRSVARRQHRQDQGGARGPRRSATTRRAPACSRRTPTTWWSTSARRTPRACATCRRSRGSQPLLRRRTTPRRDDVTDRHVPLLVKIAPDLSDDDVLAVADLVVADRPRRDRRHQHHDQPRRPAPARPPRSSAPAPAGCPGRRCGTARWRCCGCSRTGSARTSTLIGVGGITTVEDAVERLEAGADLLQAYTAFVYEGPSWPARMNRALARRPSRQLSGEGRPMKQHDRPFGARLRDAMDDRGPLCAGIDPHAGLLDAWGLTDSVNGLEKFALTATEALAPRGRGGQAAVGVLRAVRLARDRGARAGDRDRPRGRRARRPRREARRHRLDRAGLRRRLPRPALPAAATRSPPRRTSASAASTR